MRSESQGEKTQGTSTQRAWHLTVYLGSWKKINFPSKVKLPNLVFLSTWKSGAREKIVFLSALITRSAFISPVESPPLLVASWRLDSLYQVDSKSLDVMREWYIIPWAPSWSQTLIIPHSPNFPSLKGNCLVMKSKISSSGNFADPRLVERDWARFFS